MALHQAATLLRLGKRRQGRADNAEPRVRSG
jgi:hypothetical protein